MIFWSLQVAVIWRQYFFDIHGSVHRRWLNRNTQQDAALWYKLLFQSLLNAQHVSSGTQLIIRMISHSALATAGHHMGIKTRGCKYSLQLLMMSGVPLETCWAFNKLWNNKFYHKAAFCWYFYWVFLSFLNWFSSFSPSSEFFFSFLYPCS